MTSTAAPTSKREWRSHCRTYRRSLDRTSYAALSSLIVHRALGLPAVAEAQVVHTYWPITEQGEVDTRPLIETLRERGTTVVLPVVSSFDPEKPTLVHRRYEGPEALELNRWGIQEPIGTETVSPETLDVVLVPALGAGRNGQRVGHGSGYYDAFLSSVSCPRIALVYEECVAPSLPGEPHDVPMTTLVTEQNVIEIGD